MPKSDYWIYGPIIALIFWIGSDLALLRKSFSYASSDLAINHNCILLSPIYQLPAWEASLIFANVFIYIYNI